MIAVRSVLAMPLSATEEHHFGPYEILGRLGQGGMAIVYLARSPKGKRVALKVLREEVDERSDMVARFHREAQLARELRHPHIVPALDAGVVEGRHFLATRYVPSVDLWDLVEDRGPLPLDACRSLVRDLALALQALDEAGAIHRDVKPQNVLVDAGGRAMLTDFGLARPTNPAALRLTQSGVFLGTPSYAAPEQVLGERGELDIRADLYSLGVLLWFSLTGKPLYTGASRFEILEKHLDAATPEIRRLREDIDDALRDLLVWLLKKSPEDRPESPTRLLEDGEAALATEACTRGRSLLIRLAAPSLEGSADTP